MNHPKHQIRRVHLLMAFLRCSVLWIVVWASQRTVKKKRQTLFKKFHKAYRVFNFSNQLVFFVIEKILRNAKKKGSKLISESAMINGVQVAIVSVRTIICGLTY